MDKERVKKLDSLIRSSKLSEQERIIEKSIELFKKLKQEAEIAEEPVFKWEMEARLEFLKDKKMKITNK